MDKNQPITLKIDCFCTKDLCNNKDLADDAVKVIETKFKDGKFL